MSSESVVSRHKVFSYGTLKIGEPNNFLLNDKSKGEARFVSHAVTVSKYPLIIATTYNIPYLLDVEGRGDNIHGDIFEVDDKMLAFCDEFEEHPDMYERSRVQVRLTNPPESNEPDASDGEIMECWCYLFKKYKDEHLKFPTVSNYHKDEAPIYDPSVKAKRKAHIKRVMLGTPE